MPILALRIRQGEAAERNGTPAGGRQAGVDRLAGVWGLRYPPDLQHVLLYSLAPALLVAGDDEEAIAHRHHPLFLHRLRLRCARLEEGSFLDENIHLLLLCVFVFPFCIYFVFILIAMTVRRYNAFISVLMAGC